MYPRQQKSGGGLDVHRIEPTMTAENLFNDPRFPESALGSLAASAADNITGVDFASISVRRNDDTVHTVVATDPLADEIDTLQYELREGPCYAAISEERFVLVNDVATDDAYPRYGPKAAERGVGAQVAIQLLSQDGRQAGLNLYARTAGAFDRSTILLAELFSSQAAVLLGYARQVETLGEAVHARQDIGTAVGIMMERYGLDYERAFAFLARISNNRNVKLRLLARQVIDGSFELTAAERPRPPRLSATRRLADLKPSQVEPVSRTEAAL
jgi:hypothetical protein